MLASLSVRDIVLLERAELHFAPGLNVLTGETGAGKSILLDALGLAAGERGLGRTIIRGGAEQGAVSAIFDVEPRHPACALLQASELGDNSGEIILRRTMSTDGRSRAFVNDSPVGVGFAREIGAALLEVHGQSDDRGLFDTGTHRLLLDAFGVHTDLAEAVAGLHAAAAAAGKKRDDFSRSQAAAAQEIDYLHHAASELRDLAPEKGEEASLSTTRALLMNAGRLAQEIAAALDFVAGDGGAEIRLASALRRLSPLPVEGKEAANGAVTPFYSPPTPNQEGRPGLEGWLEERESE